MEISKEELDAFFQWLIDDGLAPKKSKRLWMKTITQKLLNGDKMTKENFNDFIQDHKEKLKEVNTVPNIDPKTMIGVSIKKKDDSKTKTINRAIDTGSLIHLFFDDGSDDLVHKKVCQQILESHK